MAEPTVQVPVSLMREVRAALWFHVGDSDDLARRVAILLAPAALSQPTPSAEPCICTLGPDTDGPNIECPVHGMRPSIEGMAPGTTFRITEDEDEEIWTVQDNRVAVCSDHGVGRYLDVFDPSTIRDVQELA